MAQATISQFRHLIRTLNYVVSAQTAEGLKMTTSTSLTSKTSSSQSKSLNASATPRRAKPSASSPESPSTVRRPKRLSKSASAASSSPSLSTSVEHHCAHCGSGKIQLKHVTRSFGKGANLLVIEGVPLWSCPCCGESYFTAKTMHEIERIKALRKSVAVKRSVSVAAFDEADA